MCAFATEWSNWGQNLQRRPRQIFKPNNAQGIVSAIQLAQANDRRIRASASQNLDKGAQLGAGPHTDGFSFSDVAVSHDYIVELDQLRAVLAFFGPSVSGAAGSFAFGHPGPSASAVLGAALLPAVASSTRMLAHVQGGITLEQLFIALDRPALDAPPAAVSPPPVRGRWALPTLGGSAGQTLAGAISTSTHGADFGIGPLTEMVRAIDLITPLGDRMWIEPNSAPITGITNAQQVFSSDPPTPTVVYNDEVFFSALVAFGCMGIVYSLVIELVPQFGLSQQVGSGNWSTVRELLRTKGLFSLPPWGGVSTPAHPLAVIDTSGNTQPAQPQAWAVEVYVNPYRISTDYYGDPSPDRDCVVVSRAKNTVFSVPQPVPQQPCLIQAFQYLNVAHFLTHDATQVNVDIQAIINHVKVPTAVNRYPAAFSVANGGDGQQPVLSIEFAVSTENEGDIRFVDALLERFDRIVSGNLDAKLAAAFSLRYTLPSSAYLAMQNFSTPTKAATAPVCHIEIPVLVSNPVNGASGSNALASSSAEHLIAFEELARLLGVRLHWGMLSLTNAHNPEQFGFFAQWQQVRHSLSTPVPRTPSTAETRSFQNDFTVRYRITPTVEDWEIIGSGLLPQSTTAAPDPFAVGLQITPPTAHLAVNGAVEVLAVGTDGNVCWCPTLSGPWQLVQPTDPGNATTLPFQFVGRVAIADNAGDGHPEAFALNSATGQIWHAWRNKVGDPNWQPWVVLSGMPAGVSLLSSPDVAMGPNDNLVVIARGSDGQIYFDVQVVTVTGPAGQRSVVGWVGWSSIPAVPGGTFPFEGDPCIAVDQDGSVEVFARDELGNLWQSVSPAAAGSPSNGTWQPWSQLNLANSVITGDPVAGRDYAGCIQLFAVSGPRLVTLGQPLPGQWPSNPSAWFPVSTLPPGQIFDLTTRPAVAYRLDALHVAQLLQDGSIGYFYESAILPAPPGTWNSLVIACQSSNKSVQATSPPSVVVNDSDIPLLVVRTASDLVQYSLVLTYP